MTWSKAWGINLDVLQWVWGGRAAPVVWVGTPVAGALAWGLNLALSLSWHAHSLRHRVTQQTLAEVPLWGMRSLLIRLNKGHLLGSGEVGAMEESDIDVFSWD